MSGPRYPRLSSHFLSSTPILPHRSSHLLILQAFCDSPFALLQHALPIYRENILLIYQHQVFSLSVYIVTSTFLLILLYSMSYLFTPLIGCFTEFKRFKVVILQRAQMGAIWKVAQSPAEGANNPPSAMGDSLKNRCTLVPHIPCAQPPPHLSHQSKHC